MAFLIINKYKQNDAKWNQSIMIFYGDLYIDRLVQDRCNSGVLTMELHLLCTNLPICDHLLSNPENFLLLHLLSTAVSWMIYNLII